MSQGESAGRALDQVSPSQRGRIPSLKRTISGGSRTPISGNAVGSSMRAGQGSHPVPIASSTAPPPMFRAVTSAAAFNRSNYGYDD